MEPIEEKLALLMQNGLWDHLDSFSTQALDSDPDSCTALSVRGYLLLREDKIDEAIQQMYEALKADPANPMPRCGLHLCYFRSGDFQKAESVFA